MNTIARSLLLWTAAAVLTPAQAADPDNGRWLHDEHCLACHDRSVYTREDRRVQSREQLLAQLQRCDAAVGAEWTPAQIEDVAAFLNETYYRLGAKEKAQ